MLTSTGPNWNALDAELDGMVMIWEAEQVAKLSVDWHLLSPILSRALAGKRAERVICPTTEAEVKRVIQACVRQRLPLRSDLSLQIG